MMIRVKQALQSGGDAGRIKVLIVDDDPDTLEEYLEAAAALGYDCRSAGDGASALKLLIEDHAIGVVVTDLRMPVVDGLTFLDELAVRFSFDRTIIPIVITGFATEACMVMAMRLNARDFLTKPVAAGDLARALRDAVRACTMQAASKERALRHAGVSRQESPPELTTQLQQADAQVDFADRIRQMIKARDRRGQYLDSDLFSDPVWDVLLYLTLARLDGATVAVSSACAATQLPLSTALRHIQTMVDQGLAKRTLDLNDRRRHIIEIEEKTFDSMLEYVNSIYAGANG